jgi:hypothetical protein
MTNQPVVSIGGKSPEHVAWDLFETIASAEEMPTSGRRDRKWILDTYAECLRTVREPSKRGG